MITSLGPILVLAISTTVLAGDINRQSIIFNEKTPDVFYCPQVRLGNCDLSHPFCKLCFQFSGETHFYWPNVSEKQTNEEVVWIWRKRAAWKCEVWLLEWCGWDWICLFGDDWIPLMKSLLNITISGEEENHVENEPTRSWECHHWQLCSHLQTWRIQDQEARRSGSVQNSVNHQWNIKIVATNWLSESTFTKPSSHVCMWYILDDEIIDWVLDIAIYPQVLETLIYCDIVHSSCWNC